MSMNDANRPMDDADTEPSWIIRIPTPIWLLILVVAALLVGWALELPAIVQNRAAGVLLIALGVGLSAWGRHTFQRHGAEIYPWSSSHSALVTAGPFRFMRNPMYMGILVAAIGVALVVGTWAMWLVPVVLFLLDNYVIIPFEERSMERTYGDEYRAYKARVRRWI